MPLTESRVKTVFVKVEETVTVAAGAGVQSTATETLPHDLSGQKFIAKVLISEASAVDGAPDLRVLMSQDNSVFVTAVASASMTLASDTLNSTDTAIIDCSALFAPYWRLELFTDGTNTTDSWDGDITATYLHPGVNRQGVDIGKPVVSHF